jgi:hypothetical protein
MGAERWIAFATKEERDRSLKFLATLGPELTVEGTIQGYEHGAQVWILALDSGYDPDAEPDDGEGTPCFGIEFGYSFGGDQSDDLAMLVVREMSKRFLLTRIGADSVGWYSDQDWQKDGPHTASHRYGPFTGWAEWSKVWVKEWSHRYRIAKEMGDEPHLSIVSEWIDLMERTVLEEFARLDDEVK